MGGIEGVGFEEGKKRYSERVEVIGWKRWELFFGVGCGEW